MKRRIRASKRGIDIDIAFPPALGHELMVISEVPFCSKVRAASEAEQTLPVKGESFCRDMLGHEALASLPGNSCLAAVLCCMSGPAESAADKVLQSLILVEDARQCTSAAETGHVE